MRNKKIVFGTALLLFVQIGMCVVINVSEPDSLGYLLGMVIFLCVGVVLCISAPVGIYLIVRTKKNKEYQNQIKN